MLVNVKQKMNSYSNLFSRMTEAEYYEKVANQKMHPTKRVILVLAGQIIYHNQETQKFC